MQTTEGKGQRVTDWDRRHDAYKAYLEKYPGDRDNWRVFYAGCEAEAYSQSGAGPTGCGHVCDDCSFAGAKLSGAGSPEETKPDLRAALVAATPFIFEYGKHANDRCYKYPSDYRCFCGLDEAKKIVEAALGAASSSQSAEASFHNEGGCDGCDGNHNN